MQTHSVDAAAENDLPQLLRLFAFLNPDDPPLDEKVAQAIWRRLLASEGTTVLLAKEGGVAVATCTLTVIDNLTRSGRPYALVENVVTDPGHRRRGYGGAVLEAALQRAWRAGCYKVLLSTGSKREETVRFYERAGFMRGDKIGLVARPPTATPTAP